MKKLAILLFLLFSILGCGKKEPFSIEKALNSDIFYLIPDEGKKELNIQGIEIKDDTLIINREFKHTANDFKEAFKVNILFGLDDLEKVGKRIKAHEEEFANINKIVVNYYYEFTIEFKGFKKIFGYSIDKEKAKEVSIDTTPLDKFARTVYDLKGELDCKYYFNSYKQ